MLKSSRAADYTHIKILYYLCVNAKAVCRWLCLKITSTVPVAQTASNLWIDFNSCNNRRTSIRECRLAWICRFVEAIFCFVRDRALTQYQFDRHRFSPANETHNITRHSNTHNRKDVSRLPSLTVQWRCIAWCSMLNKCSYPPTSCPYTSEVVA